MESWHSRLFKENSKFYIGEFEARKAQGQKVANLIDRAIKEKFKQRFEEKEVCILDVPCGVGRISIPLSKLGYKVTGIDYSQDFISEAERVKNLHGNGEYSKFGNADMHDLESSIIEGEKFDVIINYWTSFGYGTRNEDLNFFQSLKKYATNSTILIIETWHRENIIAFPIARTFYETEDVLQLVYNDIAPENDSVKSKHTIFQKEAGNLRKLTEFTSEIRLYSINELRDLLNEAGWKIISKHNSIGGFLNDSSFEPLLDRVVILAESM